jgi:peptidoglycan hydrolase CwlO-like protein
MVKNISLTKYQVENLENIADLLESIDYSKEDAEIKFLTLIVNIESLLPKSNIFDYVFKTDITKDKKLELQENKKQKFVVINDNVELLKSLPNDIEFKWSQVNNKYDIINNTYDEIKSIESNIQDIHTQMSEIASENDVLYGEIENIDFEISQIDNYIEESEWKVDLDSHEEVTFNKIKEKLIIEKKFNYGNI